MKDRYIGSFLGMAVCDALGMPTESKYKEQIKAEFGEVSDFKNGYLPAGSYTDDTQQAIILAKSLINNRGLNKEEYTKNIIRETDLNRGIGPTLGRFILLSQITKN